MTSSIAFYTSTTAKIYKFYVGYPLYVSGHCETHSSPNKLGVHQVER
jgi:hypothetical protein